MKAAKAAVLVVVVLAGVPAGFAARAPKSAIYGSGHDFKTQFRGASYTLCNFCHIAHKFGSAPTGPGFLLWNHTLSNVSNYGVYASDTMAGSPTELGGQLTVSNLCLSCHDGTVTIASYYEPVLGSSGQPITSPRYIGAQDLVTDISKQHPVNFNYPDATTAANLGILPAASRTSVDGNGNIPLYDGKMQCATCHDPHAGPSSGTSMFFRFFPSTAAQTATGTTCVYCHL